MSNDLDAVDRWLAEQTERIRDKVSQHVMSGGKTTNPAFIRMVGESHAYHRARSFISGARRFRENSRVTD